MSLRDRDFKRHSAHEASKQANSNSSCCKGQTPSFSISGILTQIPRNATDSELFLHMIKQILIRSNHLAALSGSLWIVGKEAFVLVYEVAPAGTRDQLIFQQRHRRTPRTTVPAYVFFPASTGCFHIEDVETQSYMSTSTDTTVSHRPCSRHSFHQTWGST